MVDDDQMAPFLASVVSVFLNNALKKTDQSWACAYGNVQVSLATAHSKPSKFLFKQ